MWSPAGRIAAAVTACSSWLALAAQWHKQIAIAGGRLAAAWRVLAYFTGVGHLLVAVTFSLVAVGVVRHAPRTVGLAVMAITLVCIGFWTLAGGLARLGVLTGTDIVAHAVGPVIVVATWLAFAPKDGLGWLDPLRWLLLPIGYVAYALTRGAHEGWFAYPQLDWPRYGWASTAANVGLILQMALAIGFALVAFARMRSAELAGTS